MSNRKLSGIVLIMFFSGAFLIIKNVRFIGQILLISSYILMNIVQIGEARHSIKSCMIFLLYNTFFLGIIIIGINDMLGILKGEIYRFAIFAVSYILVWFITVFFVDTKVAKLSTLIIGQIGTAIFLIGSYTVSILPKYLTDKIIEEIPEFIDLMNYGYTIKDILNIALQTIFYPVLVVAITMYVIAEVREYSEEKYS